MEVAAMRIAPRIEAWHRDVQHHAADGAVSRLRQEGLAAVEGYRAMAR